MSKKVLIIDDDPDIVEVMKLTLESGQYEVVTAPNGSIGLTKAEEEKPDLIILDVMMTTSDEGFNICRKLKNDPRFEYTPIMMITSVSAKTGFQFSPGTDGDWLEPDAFIEKPIQPKELIARVQKFIGS